MLTRIAQGKPSRQRLGGSFPLRPDRGRPGANLQPMSHRSPDSEDAADGPSSRGDDPADPIHFLEYKLLLKGARFITPVAYKLCFDEIAKIAKHLGVKIKLNPEPFQRRVRRILFYDTKDFDLYRHRYILRKRTFYQDGWPDSSHELTLKFRDSDLAKAASVDVRPSLDVEHRIKFKEELLPHRTHLGGIRSLYSHNCVVRSQDVVLTQAAKDVVEVFPTLASLPIPGSARIALVNNVAVDEIQVDIGALHFHHGHAAKFSISVWRDRATEESLVGEFSYQAKFKRLDHIHKKARELSETFFKAVQTEAANWIELGTTKTAIVYAMTPTVADVP